MTVKTKEIPTAPFFERYNDLKERGIIAGPSEVAARMGWVHKSGRGVGHRIETVFSREYIDLETATRLAEALNGDPVDFGF